MRIGCVKFLNARPLIAGWPNEVVFDEPSALCRMLAAGKIDVALASSIEVLRNPIYRIVDGISIASDGPVYSVIVAHEGEQPSPDIELDPASETSVVLLRCLMNDFRAIEMNADRLSKLTRSRLLIGDTAIRFRDKFGGQYRYWDLGEEWQRRTNLPFVYALWFVRPELTENVGADLRALRDENLRKIDSLISQEIEFAPEFCRRYFRDNVRFDFGDREKAGLQKFADACADLDLIPKRKLVLDLM